MRIESNTNAQLNELISKMVVCTIMLLHVHKNGCVFFPQFELKDMKLGVAKTFSKHDCEHSFSFQTEG